MRGLMERITTYRIGGIPIVYIALPLVLVGLYLAIKSKPTPEETVEPQDGDAAGGDASTDETQPIFVARPVGTSDAVVASVTQTATSDTNDAWARRCIEWLIANGTTIQTATSAIQKYLNGDALSFEEGQARDAAVKQFGLPPEEIPLGGAVGKFSGQATKQGVPPTTHEVKGSRDDTFTELALLYYNRNDRDTIEQLRAANLSLAGGGAFPPGTKVTIPKYHNPKFYKATSATRTAAAIAAKNGISQTVLVTLNPSTKFPVKVGTRVQVS